MRLGLGITSKVEKESAALKDELNRNFDSLNGALPSVMEWRPITGVATGAGTFSFQHDLGSVPDMLIIVVSSSTVTWGVANSLKSVWTKTSAAATFSGACTFFGFVGRYDG